MILMFSTLWLFHQTTSDHPSFLKAMHSKQKSKIMQINGKKKKKLGHIEEKGQSQSETLVSTLVTCYFAADYSRALSICCDINKQYWTACNLLFTYNNKLLNKIKQNIVFCQWRADQLLGFDKKIDLQDTDKSRYVTITEFNNCFIIRLPSWFVNDYLPFCHFHARAITRRKAWGLIYA